MPDERNEIVILRAAEAEADVIAMLGFVTFFEAYFEQDDPQDLANYLAENFTPEAIREEIADPNAAFYLCYADGNAAGYAKLLAGSLADGLTGLNPIELKRIYLVERYWGKGLGVRLLEHCENEARRLGHDSLWLGVWQENRRGLSFYRKHGFRKVGSITFPYGSTTGINDVLEKPL
ncbi:MAG: GNAT family N-acetyltransferase [Acidobacteria bacterium]|nr:GNAT family N-acetyltransferase [Acidobacteriota bacterium]